MKKTYLLFLFLILFLFLLSCVKDNSPTVPAATPTAQRTATSSVTSTITTSTWTATVTSSFTATLTQTSTLEPTVTATATRICLPETCNGIDDDCDGIVDNGYPVNSLCTSGMGACFASGIIVCNAAGDGVECTAVEGAPSAEVCNGIDDDCNGLVDDNLTGPLCPNQNGSCAGSTPVCYGTSGWGSCSSSTYSANNPAFQAVEYSCDDGMDNDCDGDLDCLDGDCAGTGICP